MLSLKKYLCGLRGHSYSAPYFNLRRLYFCECCGEELLGRTLDQLEPMDEIELEDLHREIEAERFWPIPENEDKKSTWLKDLLAGFYFAIAVCIVLFITLMLVTDAPPPETKLICPIPNACNYLKE